MWPKVAVLGTLRFPPDRVKEILSHLKNLVDETHRCDGCIAYDVAEDLFEPGLFRLSELGPDRTSLERHLAAPHIEPWRAAARSCGPAVLSSASSRRMTSMAPDPSGSFENRSAWLLLASSVAVHCRCRSAGDSDLAWVLRKSKGSSGARRGKGVMRERISLMQRSCTKKH